MDREFSSVAATNGLRIGTLISPYKMFCSFLLVAVCNILWDEIFHVFENISKGSTYQIIIQRIYRNIMVMGIIAFSQNMLASGNVDFPFEYEFAFYFIDQCVFIMAMTFCLQGSFIMAFSIRDSLGWERAERIRGYDLLIDVEREQQTKSWNYSMLPLNNTRDQVEFRIYRNIFSLTYLVGGEGFDFSYFLKLSHENNLLSIVDLNISKWLLLVFIFAVTCIEQQLIQYPCDSVICRSRCQLLIYTVAGAMLILFSTIFIHNRNRISEFQLFRKFGIKDVSDYEIFLMKEETIKKLLSENIVDMKTVMVVIAELKHRKALKNHHRTKLLQGKQENKIV